MLSPSSQVSYLFLSLLILLNFTGCLVESQKPIEIFSSGQFPQVLENMANPKPAEETLTRFYHKLSDPATAMNTINVAVIDNGVDYLHPQLKDKMAYQFDKQGKLKSIGSDIMGSDHFAHPNLIKAEVFAFGAREIDEEGKIVDPLSDPLQEIKNLNDKIIMKLQEKIDQDPILKGTLWNTNISEKSFSIFSLYIMALHDTKEKNYEKSMKSLSKLEKKALLLSKKNRDLYSQLYLDQFRLEAPTTALFEAEVGKSKTEELARLGHPGFLRRILDQKWQIMSKIEYYPNFSDGKVNGDLNGSLVYIEGYSRFIEVVKELVESFDREFYFLDKVKTYSQYLSTYDSTFQAYSEEYQTYQSLLHLNKAFYPYKNPSTGLRYWFSINKLFCHHLNQNEFTLLSETSPLTASAKEELALKMGTRFLSILEDTDNYMFEKGKIRDRISSAKSNIQKRKHYLPFINHIIKEKGAKLFYCSANGPVDISSEEEKKELENFGLKLNHPYLSSYSADESHGTHVSGTITKQDPGIHIYPIRITTRSLNEEKNGSEKLYNWFKQSFIEWLRENPVVLLAIKDEMVALPEEFKTLDGKSDLTSLFDYIVGEFEHLFDYSYFLSHNYLDVYFVREMAEAIIKVGQERLKVVNMSIGTEQAIGVTNSFSNDPVINRQGVFKYFQFEFFKHYIATNMQKNASHSLFVIAAGNAHKWLDGKSHSALPCDLTSKKLIQTMEKYKIKQFLPQNNIKNILCVGSINHKSDLSAFTNIPLTSIPFVVTEGEYIMSAAKTTDCTNEDDEIKKTYGPDIEIISLSSVESDREAESMLLTLIEKYDPSALKDYSKLERDKKRELLVHYQLKYIVDSHNFWTALINGRKIESCLSKKGNMMRRMSGTSMATPFVAGYLGKWLIEQAKAKKIPPQELYDDPDFTPQRIIERIMNENPIYECSKLTGICQIKEITQHQDQKSPLLFISHD